MDLICEMGANTIRLAHYQHDQYFYDLCDERGMVVWAEIPYISRFVYYSFFYNFVEVLADGEIIVLVKENDTFRMETL